LNSDRDYTYEELLERIKFEHPDEKKRFVKMKRAEVAYVGTTRTSFTNFGEFCSIIKREEKHLLNYLLAELGTSGSLDINTRLIIKGRFSEKQIENVLRRYSQEYILCHSCKSPDTHLVKNERIFFLQCEECQSRVSVASIKSGFQAQVAKRAAQRAKAS
jgi:translation initiation factor 2 subunit 2